LQIAERLPARVPSPVSTRLPARSLPSGEEPIALDYKIHPGTLAADRRRGAMPGEDAHPVTQAVEATDGLDHVGRGSAAQVDPAPATGEQRIAADQQPAAIRIEADRSGRMARCVEDLELDRTGANHH